MTDDEVQVLVILTWVICAAIGTAIGAAKDKAGTGFLLGFFLGVIGVIVIILIPADKPAPVQTMTVVQASAPSPPGWWPDPFGRHQHRYYDGSTWSAYVSDYGVQSVDAPTLIVPPGS